MPTPSPDPTQSIPARRSPADPTDRAQHPHRAPARSIECVACHRHFLTRAGSGALLCAPCRQRLRAAGPTRLEETTP
ncbi:MAG TPA: hypothetical protein VNN74_06345 [Candidatus Micrarchaeia archaeon]|nr:hypothetical protein [Candidatus Micrarchaeia archaeon]